MKKESIGAGLVSARTKGIKTHSSSIRMKRENGITLIALIITIIILLILAGVAINMVMNDGLLTKTQKAVNTHKEAEEKEQEELAKAENKMDEWLNGGDTVTPLPVDEDGYLTENYKPDDLDITIPEGFAIAELDGDGVVTGEKPEDQWNEYIEDNIDNGIVIIDKLGNEFVWVPVTKPLLDTSDTTNETEIKNRITDWIEQEGTYPMAIKLNNESYRGVLYSFTDGGTKVTITPIPYSTTGYREPDYLTDTTDGDNNTTNLATGFNGTYADWQTQVKKEYKDMVDSVVTYGGFYIGRYETSGLNGTIMIQKNKGQAGTVLDPSINQTWFVSYKKQKEMYTKENNNMQTAMIWGSQWDQVMIWMRGVKNTTDNTKFYIFNSTEMGNYNGTGRILTGSIEEYKVKNIYDLAGNTYQWTQAAESMRGRVNRGGIYMGIGGNAPASVMVSNLPTTWVPTFGARAQLYLCAE